VQTQTQATPTRAASPVGRAAWGLPVLLFLGLSLLFGATAQTSTKVSVDVYSSSLAAWRIATTGAPWLDDVDTSRIEGYGDVDDEVVFIRTAENGHRVSHRLPGPVAGAVPAYLLAGGSDSPEDFSLRPEALTAAVLTAGAMTLFFLAVRRRLGDRDALAATLVLALTTPIWSVGANALWPHTVAVLGLCGMAWAAARERWWLVGLFGGVALWGRLHAALIVAVVGIGVAVVRRRPSIAVRVGVASALFLALASLWTHWMYGTWNPGGGGYSLSPAGTVSGDRYDTGASPVLNQLGLWISPGRGILLWTPVLLLLLPALLRAWRTLPDWSRWLAIGGVAYTLVQGQLNYFTGGGAHYGYRLTLELLVCVAPAVAFSAHRAGRVARALVGPVLGVQLAVIALGAVLDGPAPADPPGWTENGFGLAVAVLPGVLVLPVMFAAAGHVAGRAWLRHRQIAPSAT
jgi:alpha-1,2-mannosyltransferase